MQREIVRAGRWLWAPVLLATVALTAREQPRRVAVRVHCTDCTRTLALALDVWSESSDSTPLDVVVSSHDLDELDAPYDVIVDDIDAAADAERDRLAIHKPGDWFAEYHDYEAINAKLRELALAAPDRARADVIGATYEGRPMWALHVGRGPTPILIDGTQHAREWIAAMVTTCVADRLVRDYASDPAIRAFVDSTSLWVVPVVNPDGYQYSWSTDRYWRKNLRDRSGVDLNRNFDLAWGGPGSSGNERAQDYRGAYAFSEPESAALRDLARRERFELHVDFHAFGQLLLYPWGFTHDRTRDDGRFRAAGDRIASAMFAQHGTRYALQQSVDLYPASGTMEDWMYGDVSALAFTIELRPKGGGGFVLPPEQIRPTCDEGLAAVLALRAAR